MKLVVDSNRVFAAFIKNSVSRRILFHNRFELFAPKELLDEVLKYKDYLCEKGALSKEGYNEIYSKLTSTVNFSLPKSYQESLTEAKSVMDEVDPKDAPFVAIGIAFALDGIWTEDPHLRAQTLVKVYSTKDLWQLINEPLSD